MKALHPSGPLTASVSSVPAALLNFLRACMPDLLDGADGGTWTPTSPIAIGGSGLTVNTELSTAVGALLTLTPGSDISDANNQTLSPANGLIQQIAEPTAGRTHDIVAAGNAGRMFFIIRPAAGAFNIQINRSGFGATSVVVLPSSTWSAALLYDDGSNWRLLLEANATAGADA